MNTIYAEKDLYFSSTAFNIGKFKHNVGLVYDNSPSEAVN